MEKTVRQQSYLLGLIAIVMLAVYSLFAWYTPVAIDDYAFMRYYLEANNGSSGFSWSGMAGYISTVWNIENGRLANYLCAPVLLWMPHWLRALSLGLVISTSFILAARLASIKEHLTPPMLVVVWAGMAMFLPWRDISSLMVVDYALNYFLSGLFLLLTLAAAIRLEKSKMGNSLYSAAIIAAFCAGLCHECFGLPLIAAMGIVALMKRFSMPVQWWGLFAAVVAGTVLCLSSPAIWSRIIRWSGSLSIDFIHVCRLLVYSGFIFSFTCLIISCALLFTRGRRWLRQIFSGSSSRYFGLIALFSAMIAAILRVEGRGFFLPDLSAIVLLAIMLRQGIKLLNTEAVILGLMLLLLFYANIIRWQRNIYLEDLTVKEAITKSGGEAIYYDVIAETPWWTFRHPTVGLWHSSPHTVPYSNYIHREADSLALVIPTILRDVDFNDCRSLPGIGDYKQIGALILLPYNHDNDQLVRDVRIVDAEDSEKGSHIGYEYIKNVDGTLWYVGRPVNTGIHGPYKAIKMPN